MLACDSSENATQCKVEASRRLRWRRRADQALAYRLAGMKLVLIRDDYAIAVRQATERLRKIQCAKSHVHGSSLYHSPICPHRLINKQSTRRHEQCIFMHAGIALSGWIRCGLD